MLLGFFLGEGGQVHQGFVALVVAVAVQVVHLAAGGGVEVQLFELQDGPGALVDAFQAVVDAGLDGVDVRGLVELKADLVELLHERALAEADFAVVPDLIAHEADPFGGVAFAGAPQEGGLGFFVPVVGAGEAAVLVVVADGFLVVVDELVGREGGFVGFEEPAAALLGRVHQEDVVAEAVEKAVGIVRVHHRLVHVVHQDVADERGQDAALGDADLTQVVPEISLVDPAELAFNLLLPGLQLLAEPREVVVPETGLAAFFEDGLLEIVPVQVGFQDLNGPGGSLPVDVAFLQKPFQRLHHASVIDDVVELLDVAFGHPDGFVLLLEFQDVGDGVVGLGHIEFLRMLAVVVAPYPVGKDLLVEQRVQQARQVFAGKLDEDLGLEVFVHADGPECDHHAVFQGFRFLEDGRGGGRDQGDVPGRDRLHNVRNEPVQLREVAGPGAVLLSFLAFDHPGTVPVDGLSECGGVVLQVPGAFVVQVAAVLLAGCDPGPLGGKQFADFLEHVTLLPGFLFLPDPLDALLDEDLENAVLRGKAYE